MLTPLRRLISRMLTPVKVEAGEKVTGPRDRGRWRILSGTGGLSIVSAFRKEGGRHGRRAEQGDGARTFPPTGRTGPPGSGRKGPGRPTPLPTLFSPAMAVFGKELVGVTDDLFFQADRSPCPGRAWGSFLWLNFLGADAGAHVPFADQAVGGTDPYLFQEPGGPGSRGRHTGCRRGNQGPGHGCETRRYRGARPLPG